MGYNIFFGWVKDGKFVQGVASDSVGYADRRMNKDSASEHALARLLTKATYAHQYFTAAQVRTRYGTFTFDFSHVQVLQDRLNKLRGEICPMCSI